MRLRRLAGSCDDGRTCPTFYATDRGTYVVQGWDVTDLPALEDLKLPPGESAVEIPGSLVELIRDAERQ